MQENPRCDSDRNESVNTDEQHIMSEILLVDWLHQHFGTGDCLLSGGIQNNDSQPERNR